MAARPPDRPPPDRASDRSEVESDALGRLVAQVLERIEKEGPAALDEACQAQPELAGALRRRVAALGELGLIGGGSAPPPRRVGDFRLLERLGSGGMGVVYLAVQESLDREVALKLIRPDVLHLPRARERFARETAIVAQLQHPGIVPIYTVGGQEEDGASGEPPYYAMERVPGCTLAEALEPLAGRDPERLVGDDLRRAVLARTAGDGAGAASGTGADAAPLFAGTWEATCLRVVRRIAEALEHAHGRNVLHRDIKPSNVMITPEGRVMLLDFGLSRSEGSDSVTREGDRVGSLPYMPPELVKGGVRAVDRRSDVYSLGVSLYQLLTLRLPFAAESVPATMAAILEGRPAPPRSLVPSISWEAETVCLAAMERDPERRYATAADFARDLGNALERRPVEARRASTALRTRRWIERRPGAATAIVLAVLLPSVAAFLLAREARRVGDALDVAEDALARAETEGARAETNRDRALRAIDAMLVRLSEESLNDVPGMNAVREETLDEAAALYDELALDRPDDPDLAVLAARCEQYRASYYYNEARYAEMEPLLRRAVDRLEPFLADGSYDLRRLHAQCLEELGHAVRNLGRPDEAAQMRLRSVAAYRQLLSENPDDATIRAAIVQDVLRGRTRGERGSLEELLATIDFERALTPTGAEPELLAAHVENLYSAAGWLRSEGRAQEALPYAEECLEQARILLAAEPDEADHRHQVVRAGSVVAGTLMLTGDEARALDVMHETAVGIETLLHDFPGVTKYEETAADVYINLGAALARERRLEESLDAFEHAAGLLEGLSSRLNHPLLFRELGTTWINMASVLLDLEGDAEAALEVCDLARESLERACALAPENVDFRGWLALERNTRAKLLLALDRPAEAAEELASTPELAAHRVDYLRSCLKRFGVCWSEAQRSGDPDVIERVRAAARELTRGALARGDVNEDPVITMLVGVLEAD